MSHRFIRICVVVVAVALVAGGLAACGTSSPSGSSSAASAGTPQKGGVMTVTYQGEPQSLDPAIDWEGNGWSMEHCLYNTLLTYSSGIGSAGTKLVPDMATEVPTVANGGITNGGKTYIFHLRPGIKFAPPINREVTAQDFKYSFERMMSPKTQPTPPGTGFYMSIVGAQAFNSGKAAHVAGFKAIGKYTIEVDLVKPDVTILNALTMPFTSVVPKEWVEKWGRQFGHHPLGTGPYMMDHWTPGQELVLKRNPNWFDWRGYPEAWVNEIDVRFSVTPTMGLLMLKRGENDLLGDYIASSDYVAVTTDPVWKKQVALEPAIANDYLFLNVRMKPFDNLKVRQAIAWAIDRSKLIKLISGAGSPLSQIYPAGLPGHVDGAAGQFYGYDPAKAKQLLTEAGYPNGFTTTLFSHNVDPWPKVVQSIQNDLAAIGIKANLKLLDRATYWTLTTEPGKVPMGLQDWWQDFPDPSDFIVPLFTKGSAIPGGNDPSFWWDPQVEKLLAQTWSMTDTTRRLAVFDEIQKIIMAQAPAVPLYQPNVDTVFSKRLHGVYLHPVWIFDFLDYWIKQ